MAAFNYRALDTTGLETSGTLEAENARQARALLRERGMFPTSVEPINEKSAVRRRRIGLSELCLLTRQFSALLTSGLTIERALAALSEQADSAGSRALLAAVRSEVVAGHSLRTALDLFGNVFPPIYRASVAAGEKSGQLAHVMTQLADYMERQDALRRKTTQALIYPCIVAVVAFAVIIGLMTYVVPQVVEVFQQGKQTLPFLTRAMIFTSDVLRNWGWLIALVAIGGFFAARFSLREESVQRRWDAWLLNLPWIGRHIRSINTARFASTLAILVSSGVPLLSALDAGRQIMGRLPLRDAVGIAADKVREGMALSSALRQTQAFPPLLLHMISSGEATGELSQMLDRSAQLQQTEVENRTMLLTTLLEPILLLVMGGAVLVIVLAVMEPIIEINTMLK